MILQCCTCAECCLNLYDYDYTYATSHYLDGPAITQLALPGTNLSYTCPCTGTDIAIFVDLTGGGVRITPTDQNLANHLNISAHYGSSIVTVFILTSLERNVTITCVPLHPSTTCTHTSLCLFVVKGKSKYQRWVKKKLHMTTHTGPPAASGAPTLTVNNMTALTLTWTAPWSLPISNYTVTVSNTSSGVVSQFTVAENQFVLRRGGEGGGGQCDELVFTVEAETDVGSSGTSPNTTGGFSKGI